MGFWRIRTIGAPSESAYVLACNHVSWIDIIYFLTSHEVPSFVSKETVKKAPFIGTIAMAMQCLFINRLDNREQALDLLRQRQLKLKNQELYPKLLVFPEGTTTNGSGLLYFKKGGFIGKVPVQPICLKYSGSVSPAFEVIPLIPSIIFLMTQFASYLTVTRLATVFPKDAFSPEEYAECVRTVISEGNGTPKSALAYEEKLETLSAIFKVK